MHVQGTDQKLFIRSFCLVYYLVPVHSHTAMKPDLRLTDFRSWRAGNMADFFLHISLITRFGFYLHLKKGPEKCFINRAQKILFFVKKPSCSPYSLRSFLYARNFLPILRQQVCLAFLLKTDHDAFQSCIITLFDSLAVSPG